MNRFILVLVAAMPALPVAASAAATATVDELLAGYRAQGADTFSAAEGGRLWQLEARSGDGTTRHCGLCHGSDLASAGRHARTGEPIDPMAPSANPKRLTERRTIEKWLLRNCKWTFGRECTPQEKGDLLSYLRLQ